MIYGFDTTDQAKAQAAMLIYVVYKSRDSKRGPSGLDMWGQIERFAKMSAKRSDSIDDFIDQFKRKMACSTINPYWMRNDFVSANAVVMEDGSIVTFANDDRRSFGLELFDNPQDAANVLDCIYRKTQIIILLVRDRLEREKFAGREAGHED